MATPTDAGPRPPRGGIVVRTELAPEINEAFENFSRAVFAEGALPEKTKQLIAVAVAHVTQCPYCITGHTKLARRKGARPEEIMEAIWVAAEMRAGGAYAHSTLALHALGDGSGKPSDAPAGATPRADVIRAEPGREHIPIENRGTNRGTVPPVSRR